ncbi:MAG: Uncharacterised protein [Cryomorphaceae bacterium]|nr:MAG: Uncharacterised protein [Cryomorphaceae bacterium]
MLNRIFKTILLGIFALVITTTFTSCKKEKETIAVVIVQDGSGNVVPQARVILHANELKESLYTYDPDDYANRSLDLLVKDNLDTTYSSTGQYSNLFKAESTDNNGRVEFTLPLEMILNVSVLKVDGNDEYLGANIINIQKEKTTTQVVKLLNY